MVYLCCLGIDYAIDKKFYDGIRLCCDAFEQPCERGLGCTTSSVFKATLGDLVKTNIADVTIQEMCDVLALFNLNGGMHMVCGADEEIDFIEKWMTQHPLLEAWLS